MKFFTLLFTILTSVSQLPGQAPPEAFNYSGAAMDGSGNPLSEETIGVEFSILQSSASGTVVYREQHTVLTNSNGVFNLGIGLGSVQEGVFSEINWGENSYFLKVGIDPTGGTSYTTSGVTQLLSVPYALYAKNAGGVNGGLKPLVEILKNNGYVYNDSSATISLEGVVYSEGSAAVSENGFVWSYSSNPTIVDNKIMVSDGGGHFKGSINLPLSGGNLVYYKPYAINQNGVNYSNTTYKYQLNPYTINFTIDSVQKINLYDLKLFFEFSHNHPNNLTPFIGLDTIPNSKKPIRTLSLPPFQQPISGMNEIIVNNLNPNTTYYFTPITYYDNNWLDNDEVVNNKIKYYGREFVYKTDSILMNFEGVYVGELKQNRVSSLPGNVLDTINVSVDYINYKANVSSKYFGYRTIEIDLNKVTENIINLDVLNGFELENTTSKKIKIVSIENSSSNAKFVNDKLFLELFLFMNYDPKNLFDLDFKTLFTGEYTKQ